MNKDDVERIADVLEEISRTLNGIYELLYILANKYLEKSKR